MPPSLIPYINYYHFHYFFSIVNIIPIYNDKGENIWLKFIIVRLYAFVLSSFNRSLGDFL